MIVCGGRHFDDRALVWDVLDYVRAKVGEPGMMLVHGDCPTGADHNPPCNHRVTTHLSIGVHYGGGGSMLPLSLLASLRASTVDTRLDDMTDRYRRSNASERNPTPVPAQPRRVDPTMSFWTRTARRVLG